MIRILLSGCSGRMGQVITDLVSQTDDMQIVAGIDIAASAACTYPVFASPAECTQEADVIIDFSSPAVFDALLDYAVEKQVPAVICTTGLSEDQIGRLEAQSAKVALLRSANMSLGINLLMKLLKDAAAVLSGSGYDVEIIEKHHNRKKDAPSGTALALADSVNEGAGGIYEYIFDRSGRYEQRSPKELGISAVRGGTIVGEHEVLFAGTDEVITFTHTAYSRALFAKGAVAAARYLSKKGPGMYTMADVIEG